MRIKFNYLENVLEFGNKVLSLEIENKGYFYRCISDFIYISNGDLIESFYCFDDKNEEIVLSNKVIVVSDYFNFDNLFKRYNNSLNKFIINECDDEINTKLAANYKKIKNDFVKLINKIELPIVINDDFSLDLLIKLLKPQINCENNLLNNLFLLIELEKIFKINKILVFVNLKQYLNKDELLELYKYSLYNSVNILLIDSQSYGPTIEYETKIIIDENLNEIVL